MEEPKTYSLKKGTVMYRGDTPFYLANKDMPSESLHLEVKPTFLALEPDDVYQYGIIYGWEVPEDIELPLIDNHDVMTGIYKDAPPDVQQVMRENYGYLPDGFGDRVSYFEKDILFYQYLCEKGYPGYASHDLEEGVRTSVEIMVCNPSGYKCSGMFFPNDVGDKELYIRNQIQKYYERVNPNGKQKKKKAMVAESPGIKSGWSPMKGSLSFGDSPSATPIKGNLFGDSPSATPIKGNLFGDSPGATPIKGNLFGDSPGATPIKGNLFGDDSHVFNTPKKGGKSNGGKSKRNLKSKRNRKSKVTRRR
jgi:hypothetical protein